MKAEHVSIDLASEDDKACSRFFCLPGLASTVPAAGTATATTTSSTDVTTAIDACLSAPTEQSIGVASLELYRHKRDHPDDPNVSLLEGALDSAKRACRREGA